MPYAWENSAMHITFWREDLKGRDYLEDLGVDGSIKSKEIGWESVDGLYLA